MVQLTTITDSGLAAIFNAQAGGVRLQVTGFKIGSDSGFVPQTTDLGVHTKVYDGQPAQLTYRVDSPNRIIYRIVLDGSVGGFTIGNIGLYLSTGELFAIASLVAGSPKTANNLPAEIGNVKVYDLLVTFANVNSLINFNIVQTAPTEVPKVLDDLGLPAANASPFSLYLVKSSASVNNDPAFAYTDGTVWTFMSIQNTNFAFYAENNEGGIRPQISDESTNSLALGNGAVITGTGQRSIAFGFAYTEGSDNFIAQIGSTLLTFKSTGSNLIVIGTGNVGGNDPSHQYNTVIGGSNNLATGQYNAIISSQNSTTSGVNTTIVGGKQANASIKGQRSYAVGRFARNGDAQHSDFILRAQSVNATPLEMFIDGTDHMILRDIETWFFSIRVSARRIGLLNESAGFDIKGVIDRQNGYSSTALVNTPQTVYQSLDVPGWAVVVSADNGIGGLKIMVTGEAGKDINWVAYVEVVIVSG